MIIIKTKIPLIIHPSFWVLSALIGWLYGPTVLLFFEWVLVVFISVLVHELGHALLAKMWGKTVRIELGPFGGLTTFQGTLPRLKEFLVVLMGPLFGFALCGIAMLLLPFAKNPLSFSFLQIMFWANLAWSIFNLVPVHPLDGGKLMLLGLEGIFGNKGTKASYFLSSLFGLIFAVFFFFQNSIIAGALFFMCAFESFRAWQASRFPRSADSNAMIESLRHAEIEWAERQPERAIKRLEEIVSKEKQSDIGIAALERLANYLIATGQNRKAFSMLEEMRRRLSFEGLKLLQLAAYKLGEWKLALDVGSQVFLETSNMPVAILNAFAAAHLNDVQAAINWLAAVKKSKLMDMSPILASADLDPVRNDPLFKQFTP